ncbi:MAG: signal peptidase I [candidate division NC10 bacterium]|jgi:signal peptidase I
MDREQEREAPVQVGESAAPEARERRKSVAREWLEALAVAVLLALFIRTFVVQAFKIPSGSMIPTLLVGDHILVNKFIYGVRIPVLDTWIVGPWVPERQDIIVFKYPHDESRDFIKRVIGLPGDVVEVRGKRVYINEKPLDESYLVHADPAMRGNPGSPGDFYGPITVPEDKLFVLGDNRDHSQDSRFWGFLDIHKVEGEAFIIYWSWDSQEGGPRWNRLGKLID